MGRGSFQGWGGSISLASEPNLVGVSNSSSLLLVLLLLGSAFRTSSRSSTTSVTTASEWFDSASCGRTQRCFQDSRCMSGITCLCSRVWR